MTAKNRAALIGKLHTALKKHFKPAPPSPGRPLMEHVLYASLLEESPADLADEGFAKCEQEFFDWNEVRVTTVTELAEVLSRLPSPQNAAIRLKKNLQGMFETFYNFDIDHLKKENLGKAVAKFESMPGMSPFVLSYLIQHGLGGHSIPVDRSSLQIMWLSGIVSDSEFASGKVPGLERTIAKNKAIEFSSLLHQAGVAYHANSKDKVVWEAILSVNKDAKSLLDKVPTGEPKKPKKAAAPAAAAVPVDNKAAATKAATTKSAKSKTAPPVTSAKEKGAPPKAATKSVKAEAKAPEKPDPKKPVTKQPVTKQPITKQPVTKQSAAKKPVSEKKVAPKSVKATPAAAAKPAAAKKSAPEPASKSKTPVSKAADAAKPATKNPVTKKSAPVKVVADDKGSNSTNKNLTKQKPR